MCEGMLVCLEMLVCLKMLILASTQPPFLILPLLHRLILGREELIADAQQNPAAHGQVAIITIRGNFLFDPATHRDFLGASLNTGIQRSQVGDIITQGETGAQMLVADHMVGHFETSLTHVKKVPVVVQSAPLSELRVREPKVEELRSVEASLRLDAIASAGFRTSRSKVSDWISKGDVRYVWFLSPKKGEGVVRYVCEVCVRGLFPFYCRGAGGI